jgi:hypothetical protein
LTPIGATVVGINPSGSGNLDIAVSSDSKFLYSLNSENGTIGVFGRSGRRNSSQCRPSRSHLCASGFQRYRCILTVSECELRYKAATHMFAFSN